MRIALIISVVANLFLMGILMMSRKDDRLITAVSRSPDGNRLVRLVEKPALVDRNFKVTIADSPIEKQKVIFNSPDEGMPRGSETFFWSDDSRYLLLTGQHFFVIGGVDSKVGKLYLLYDTQSGEIWCNAKNLDGRHFSQVDLRSKGFSMFNESPEVQ
jgi:hypothetical protein